MTRGNAPSRTDANHWPILEKFREIGWPAKDIHATSGLGDILTRHRDGWPVLLEVKLPENRRRLTDREQEIHEMFPGYHFVVCDWEEAFAVTGLTEGRML